MVRVFKLLILHTQSAPSVISGDCPNYPQAIIILPFEARRSRRTEDISGMNPQKMSIFFHPVLYSWPREISWCVFIVAAKEHKERRSHPKAHLLESFQSQTDCVLNREHCSGKKLLSSLVQEVQLTQSYKKNTTQETQLTSKTSSLLCTSLICRLLPKGLEQKPTNNTQRVYSPPGTTKMKVVEGRIKMRSRKLVGDLMGPMPWISSSLRMFSFPPQTTD